MRTQEVDRWYVVREVMEGKPRQREAGRLLGKRTRQIRRLVARVRKEGKRGVMHGLKGRASARHTAAATVAAAVRRLMIRAQQRRAQRGKQRHRAWRERRQCVGMLVQVDGSEHAWFEARGARCTLIMFVDDATGRIMEGLFEESEDTLTLVRLTRR